MDRDPQEATAPQPPGGGNRYDLAELAGAFGDLGTLIPFAVAYISLLGMDPGGVLLPFGAALVVAGLYFRTPFPVQPMKVIGAAAITQSVGGQALTVAMVTGAGFATALIWLVLGATGLASRLARLFPGPPLVGMIMGLGFSFMPQGLHMMADRWLLSAGLLALTLVLLARSRVPAMLVLLAIGAGVTLVQQPSLADGLALIRPELGLPGFAWPAVGWRDLLAGTVLLALPQLPLTFGNALVAITDENNRLFPRRPVTHRQVALSTGAMNLLSSALGGIPMCHGAGGMAGHVKFGARTGGASVILGGLLIVLALFFGNSVAMLFRLFPPSVLGVILFLAGAELAIGSREADREKGYSFVVLTTAALAVLNVGTAMVYGFLAYHASRRGWLRG